LDETDVGSRSAFYVGPFTTLMRFIVRKLIVHFCITFGIIGNSLTLTTLLHKLMRNSCTTTYLLALTIIDSLYLICIFMINLETNYPQVAHTITYNVIMLVVYPLTDLCSNTSNYVVLVFTIERYLAVSAVNFKPLIYEIFCRFFEVLDIRCFFF
jgi:hypothetical protein